MADMQNQIIEKLAEIQGYRSYPLFSHFIELLDLIDKQYDDDFRHVTPENLRYKQGGAGQVRALSSVLIDPDRGDLPKI